MMSSPVRSLLAATLVSLAALVSACGSAPAPFALFPSGQSVLLLDAPVHLGDNRAGGQSFPNGTAEAGRICSLVNLPRAAQAYLQVSNVRQSESLGDMVTINGRGISLPMTLERDHAGVTPNATSASPIHAVSLPAGPSEICLVAGMRQCGDLDDFEVDQPRAVRSRHRRARDLRPPQPDAGAARAHRPPERALGPRPTPLRDRQLSLLRPRLSRPRLSRRRSAVVVARVPGYAAVGGHFAEHDDDRRGPVPLGGRNDRGKIPN
ncbi:MAG: hypothetical protein IPQ09_22670 [Myxococcales bacterium]|nr:hypothetical protein [Myxococcales bacterium]